MSPLDHSSPSPRPSTGGNQPSRQLLDLPLPPETRALLAAAPSVTVAGSHEELIALAVRDAREGNHEVDYEVPGVGRVVEANVCRTRNGISANYIDPYMRRRDPDCMVIGDERPTDKTTYVERFGASFDPVREETFAWLKTQPLAVFAFYAGLPSPATQALVIAPDNAGFFALGLALLQGIVPVEDLPDDFQPKAIIYVAPPFRHTHFEGRQVVVHNRRDGLHEVFSYNLYPGPSAKKGVYGVLLNIGEEERWVTMHCATVQVVTPYENKVVISHEGASGGGKSEMLEYAHRRPDGTLLIGRNLETGEKRKFTLPKGCDLRPVTDDMALCHPSLEKGNGKLSLIDAEEAWFVRCNHIDRYGTDPHIEALTVHPPEPLLFLNIEGRPGATTLIWEHIEDAPGEPCPNPRVVIPRKIIPDVVNGAVDVDVRSMGVRTPPCSAARPTYGIVGLFHLLPPALAWLWRLVAPRGHANPSIVETAGMTSEGVGSYWPFATGRMVDHANLLLNQIIETPEVRYVLIPNQHIGIWEVGFMPQWIAREYFARRGGARFAANRMRPSRCSLLGYTPGSIMMEGSTIGNWFFEVEHQPEVGPAAYDQGAAILTEFFHRELKAFLGPDLLPTGQRIIECCLQGGHLEDYQRLLDLPFLEPDEG
ncbi:DUF4914 domain-containing protein [Lamprobacter modestohalophilus]|uniref:DUF4914 domain-containing protein n=1 Tax=Lamprobacter modestohalophilus TaxID=1064514 RepID=A0A9X0W8T2_9GAMM|nr:DUF4914 family protein [Lamprobacter modestohalophilus]MBK1619029.1 DUF4914 domain-containing protein [Lamprobacter modestohalophilus]